MKCYKGTPSNITTPVVGIATHSRFRLQRSGYVLVSPNGASFTTGFSGVITGISGKDSGSIPMVRLSSDDLIQIVDGDCVVLSNDGQVAVVWDNHSNSNSLFVTESCDCRCIMCPQPPGTHQEITFNVASKILDLLKPEQVKTICITGGEPTLLGDKFIELVSVIKNKFNHAFVMILTNGKNFSSYNFARDFANVGLSNSLICVSLHSDIEELNDTISGSKGSFHKTVQGLYNLARFRQRVEIRHVVSKLNAHRLEQYAEFVYRNFPFACHFAFMGMEMTGIASEQYENVWIDPYEYRHDLYNAVRHLHRANLDASIYNIPLCILERKAWSYARQSISDWKNVYQDCCEGCSVKLQCGGFFSTSGQLLSSYISKIN